MNLKRDIGLLAIFFGPLFYIITAVAPMPQNLEYHNFADHHTYFGIPHFHNVITNIFFLLVASYGLIQYKKSQQKNLSWLTFLLSVLLVGPGSAYYHLDPNNQTLFWDRLPMTLGFISLTCFSLFELFAIKKEAYLLFAAQILGFSTLMYWVIYDDLRFYLWVQFTPILLLAYIAFILSSKTLRPLHLSLAVILYVLAKITEHSDGKIFQAINYSGHSIKHILAALAVFVLIQMKNLKTR